MIKGYPKCFQCECQINLIDINGTCICHRCFKEIEKFKNMANAKYGREIYSKSKLNRKVKIYE